MADVARIFYAHTWKLGGGERELTVHLGSWCAPCKRAFPVVLEEMRGRGRARVTAGTEKPERVKLVPWLEVRERDGRVVESLQSSQKSEILAFLRRNTV